MSKPPATRPAVPTRGAGSPGVGAALSVLVPLTILLGLIWRFDFLVDDAFIAFRYAVNWASGEGLRYHLGSATPVEGFSDPLWVALLALGKLLGCAPELAARALSVTCSVACLLLLRHTLQRDLSLGAGAVFLGTLFLATFTPAAVWATGGLETAAFSLAIFASWRLLAFGGGTLERSLAWLLPGILVGLRVEGLAWAMGLCLITRQGKASREATGMERNPRRTFLIAALLAGALLTAARLWWFGEAVPNTVHAKSGFSLEVLQRGLRTLASFGLVHLSVPLIALLFPLTQRSPQRGPARSAGLMLLGLATWNIFVGGDWMPFFRFLAPAAPFLALLLAISLDARMLPGAHRRFGPWPLGLFACALSLAPAFGWHPIPREWRAAMNFRSFRTGYQTELERWQTGVRNVENFTRIGLGLAQVERSDATLVAGAIGALGFYSGAHILDRNGLVEARIARGPVTETRSAGHDKRVPRSFFIADRPTWYEVLFVDHEITGGRFDAFRRATAILHGRVFADRSEAALLDCTQAVAYPLRAEGPIPGGSSLILLQHTDDEQIARDFWSGFGP